MRSFLKILSGIETGSSMGVWVLLSKAAINIRILYLLYVNINTSTVNPSILSNAFLKAISRFKNVTPKYNLIHIKLLIFSRFV